MEARQKKARQNMTLLTKQSASPKLAKSRGEFLSAILYLAPARLSGWNVCPKASPGCIKACLNTAGRGRFTNIQQARIKRALLYLNHRGEFLEQLRKELLLLNRKAIRLGVKPVVRLNGTSDLPWELSGLLEEFPFIQFYDYTKNLQRCQSLKLKHIKRELLNYHLTFSRSETNEAECLKALNLGVNVAVVFKHGLPPRYLGRPVIDGDTSDYRFVDPPGYIIGLTAKGLAKRDRSGFIVDTDASCATRYTTNLTTKPDSLFNQLGD
jgi:hypothetical protein